jgi:hypothetical protein
MQGASSSSITAEGEGLRHLASGVGKLHLARVKLSACAKQNLKKEEAKQEPGSPSMSKLGETLIRPSKRPSSEGSTPVGSVRPPKMPRDI